ncbi:MAG: hypothetical protein ACYTFO_03660 [Planctomycetota bacterium]|jgi:hypothetical protein
MRRDGCYAKIRFTLTDEAGQLCFEAFDMPDAESGCGEVFRKHLIGRPLAEIDPKNLLRLKGEVPRTCLASVLLMIRENQRAFLESK